MCRYWKPWFSKARACAAGSSLKTVAALHLAELEAHALAVFEVDGGKEDQGALLGWKARRAACGQPSRHQIAYISADREVPPAKSRPASERCRARHGLSVSEIRRRPPAERRPLTEADAVDIWIARWLKHPPPRPCSPLWLRPAPALRDLGRRALSRRPRQGLGAVRASAIRRCSTASISARTGASRASPIPTSSACSIADGPDATPIAATFFLIAENGQERDENKRWTRPMIRGMFSLRSARRK